MEHLEKENVRYVIATFDNPTSYVVCKGGCNYSFIDNIEVASKFTNQFSASIIADDLTKQHGLDLVVLKLIF